MSHIFIQSILQQSSIVFWGWKWRKIFVELQQGQNDNHYAKKSNENSYFLNVKTQFHRPIIIENVAKKQDELNGNKQVIFVILFQLFFLLKFYKQFAIGSWSN